MERRQPKYWMLRLLNSERLDRLLGSLASRRLPLFWLCLKPRHPKALPHPYLVVVLLIPRSLMMLLESLRKVFSLVPVQTVLTKAIDSQNFVRPSTGSTESIAKGITNAAY